MSTQIYRPSEVADLLGISASTLRRWSQQYSKFLSVAAGKHDSDEWAGGKHRRYSRADVQLLAQIQTFLKNGLTHAEVQNRLSAGHDSPEDVEEEQSTLIPEPEPAQSMALSPLSGASSLAQTDATQLLTSALDVLSDSQQMLLSGQHTERQLIGVLLQDNFNLKEENSRLRERMLEAERKLYELKREIDGSRTVERERMRQMESSLFELQRRLDSISNRTVSPTPPPPVTPPADVTPPEDIAPAPAPTPLMEEQPLSENQVASKPKSGLWARLWGRNNHS
ncbi:MAG: MerR family transcriptional regulator [Chloroflexi bacterium]|nr:MerR family transcriptional regulator [Chloroflexota bacterium]